MTGSLVVGLGVAAVLLSVGSLAVFVRYRWRTRARRALASSLDARLADAMAPGTGSHLEQAPAVRRIVVVGTHDDVEDGRPVYVPIVRVDLETTDAPGTKLLLEYVADVLEAIHPVVRERDEYVAHYDVEFTFGPDGLFVEGECRRVTVSTALADRLLEDDRFGAFELWREVKRTDRNGGDPTTLWGECRSDSRIGSDRAATTPDGPDETDSD